MADSFTNAPVQPIKPEPPNPAPTKPVYKKADRRQITLAIGVDHTRSAISKEIPTVKQAIMDFIERGGILKAGDEVFVCEFDTKATCDGFKIPNGTDDLKKEFLLSIQQQKLLQLICKFQ